MRAADVMIVAARGPAERERGGLIGTVQAIVLEHPGLTTREIRDLLSKSEPPREPTDPGPSLGARVSGCLNKLKLEERVTQDWTGRGPCRWRPKHEEADTDAALTAKITRFGMRVDALCPGCQSWILFGSLATAEDRTRPRCGLFPFARRGAA